ncbi:MAG TPA: imelysin family protein [Bacteroidia bacterium]|nr:imelysin family protein [Bacteroidia bacterium]
MKKNILFLFCTTVIFLSCRKHHDDDPQPATSTLTADVLSDLSDHVIGATYNDLEAQASVLYQDVLTLQAATNETNLSACRQSWRECRSAWEQSEGFLFGPVESQNIDPRIDTWPVNFNDLDSVLSSSAVFTSGYIDSLDDALKGFHPVEYLLFGVNGNKAATDFTPRQLDLLTALTENLRSLTASIAAQWNAANPNGYRSQFVSAGSGSTVYTTQRSAFEEMVNAMSGICDEVANEKIDGPYVAQDPSLEESPFAFNSTTDFTNNIKSVRNIYLGSYTSDGKGIEDLVRQYDLSLDGSIKQKINAALAALGTVTVPFGQAIAQQPVQLQNSMSAISDLQQTIDNQLMPFIQAHTN